MNNRSTTLRRSDRRPTLTVRGKAFQRCSTADTLFPVTGDEILVQWLSGRRLVWWRATVIDIEESTSTRRRGEVLYHSFGDYPESEATVIFSTSRRHRFVASIDSETNAAFSEESSWIFSGEVPPSVSNAQTRNESIPSSSTRPFMRQLRSGAPQPTDQVVHRASPSSARDGGLSKPSSTTHPVTRQVHAEAAPSSAQIRHEAPTSALRPLARQVNAESRANAAAPSASTCPNTQVMDRSGSRHLRGITKRSPRSRNTSVMLSGHQEGHNSRATRVRLRTLSKSEATPPSRPDEEPAGKQVIIMRSDNESNDSSDLDYEIGQPVADDREGFKSEGKENDIKVHLVTDNSNADLPLRHAVNERPPGNSQNDAFHPTVSTEVQLRLERIERQIAGVSRVTHPLLSASAHSLIVSLRWAFLKALEKPLKMVYASNSRDFGLSREELSVTVPCDYSTFKEITAALDKEHECTLRNPNSSRVAFSPLFHTTQNGSTSANDMNVLFASLVDLTSFLRIRDDKDYESVLSKEVVTETLTVLRLLGSFLIDDRNADSAAQNSSKAHNDKSTGSVCETSQDTSERIRMFVGSSPVVFKSVLSASSETTANDVREESLYTSTIFEQDCKFFCPTQKCFLTPWTVRHIKTHFNVFSYYNMDGTVDGSMNKFFRLNWKRQTGPSSGKWTKDVQDVGNNSPGYIRLSVPVVFITASRNVQKISSLLDTHIETFMRVRSKMHSHSSFK